MERIVAIGSRRGWLVALIGAGLTLVAAACAPGPSPEVRAKEQEIASLKAQLATAERDARYWKQLTALLQPVEMKSMTDHRAYMLPSGVVIALHFDSMDLSKAENLNWVALGLPGRFCKSDQERVEQEYGAGKGIFTHFHDMKNDVHGGQPGAEGVWFVHVAVREFDSPMSGGRVQPGPDTKFMPTPAPGC
jgi:hypothetical protein